MRSAKKLITLYSLLALSGPTLAACGGSSELFGSSLSSGSSGSSGGSGSGRSQETTGEDYVPAEQQEDVTKPIGYYISLSLSPDSDVTGTDSYADSQPLRIYLRLKDGAPFTPSSVTFGGTDYALSQDNEGNFYFDYIVAENNAPELQLTAVKTADGVIWDGAMSLYFNKPVELPTESSTDPHAEPDAEPDAELGSESTPESTNPSTATSSTTSSTRSTTAAVPVVSPEPVPALTPEATTKASPATTAESAASATPESTSSTSTKSTTSQVIAPSEPSGEVVAEPSSSRPTTSAATSTTTTQAPEPYTVAVQWAWVDPTTVEFVATGRGESVTITDDNGAQLATVESTRGGARVRVTADGSTDLHWAINTDEVSESAGQGGVQAERIITEANGVVDAAMRISYGHVTGVDIYRVVNGTPVEQAAGSAAVGDIAVVRFSNGMTRMRDITAVDGEGLTLAIRGDSARLRSYAGLFPSSFNSDPRESNGAVEAASTGWRIALDSNGSPRAVGDEASTSRAQDNLYLLAPYLDPAVRARAAYFLPADSVLRSHAISQIVPRAADGSALGYVGPDNYSQVASVLIAFEDAAPITLPVGTSQVDDSVISFDISSSIAGFNGGLWYQPATGYFNADTSYISALYTKVAAATNVNWPAEEAQSRVGLTDNWEDYKTNRLKGDLATVIAADPLWNSVGDNAAYRKIATSLGTPLVRESSDTVAQTDATRVALLLNWNDRGFRYDFDGMKASTLFLAYRGDTARSHLGYGAVRALSQQSRFDKWTMLLANGGRWANVFYSDGFGGTKNFAEATEKWVRRFTEFGTDYSAWAESTFKGHVFKPAETSYKGHDYSLWTNLRNFNYGGNPSNLGGTINSILSVSGPVTSPTREDGTWSPGARGGNNTQASNYMDPSMFMVVLPGTLAFGNAGLYTKEEFARVGETFTENSTAFMQRLNNFVPDYFSELTSAKYGGGIYPVWDTKGNANASYTDTDNPYMNQFAQLFRGARSAYSGGTAAYAQGPEIHFTIRLLTGYQTFTHEFTHVTDDNGPLFGGNSILRRVANWALGAETTTTNTFEQGFNYSSFAPNLTYTTVPANAMSNYSWERLQSDEDYKSYYKGLFDTLNLLNYAQAMAYIKLPWEDQTKLGSQARYMTSASQILNNESSTAPLDRVGTEWRHLDVIYAGSQSSLQLRTLESLWDNRIVINPNFVRSNTIMQFSSNSYSSTPGAAAMWFTPHNDFGVSDGVINKYYAFMMAGEAGWQGTKNVLSGTMTDLQMLRASTGDENATWRSYTLNSMRQAASEASARGVDVDAMIEKFYQAMLADSRGAASYAENNQKSWSYKRTVDQRLAYFNEIKQATDDFRTAYRP